MSKRKWSDLTPTEQEVAKQRYMEYQSVASIAEELNVSRTTLQYHVKTYWEQERELLKAELFSRFTATKRSKFIEMSESSINIISKALKALAHRGEPPTTREAKDAVNILEALDKITRLDDGRPTEITEEKVMDMDEIHSIATLVPFKPRLVGEDVEEAEYEEINKDDKESDNN